MQIGLVGFGSTRGPVACLFPTRSITPRVWFSLFFWFFFFWSWFIRQCSHVITSLRAATCCQRSYFHEVIPRDGVFGWLGRLAFGFLAWVLLAAAAPLPLIQNTHAHHALLRHYTYKPNAYPIPRVCVSACLPFCPSLLYLPTCLGSGLPVVEVEAGGISASNDRMGWKETMGSEDARLFLFDGCDVLREGSLCVFFYTLRRRRGAVEEEGGNFLYFYHWRGLPGSLVVP